MAFLNPLSAKFIKWSNTLKQIVDKLPTICLSVFDHFSGLALKGLTLYMVQDLHEGACSFKTPKKIFSKGAYSSTGSAESLF